VFAELVGLLNRQLADYDKRLELALAKHPDAEIFLSFPGVGRLTAATLLTEIGEDRDHYPAVGMLAEAGPLRETGAASEPSSCAPSRWVGGSSLVGPPRAPSGPPGKFCAAASSRAVSSITA
jgi:hypothetical protein